MPRIEPNLVPVVTDLERGLRELGIPFAIVGALVPELLLSARPRRMTNDADVTVIVDNLADFNALKDRLAAYGFTRTRVPHRMQHRDGGLMDVLPKRLSRCLFQFLGEATDRAGNMNALGLLPHSTSLLHSKSGPIFRASRGTASKIVQTRGWWAG
jgi:hypothetical protein